MKASFILISVVLTSLAASSSCSILATKGYMLSSPNARNFLIKTGLGTLIARKSAAFYDASNFRYASDQGTDIRKAQMNNYEILEIDPAKTDKKGLTVPNQNFTREEDRLYSERLFSVLNEMDRNSCVYRLLCEIGADPKSFGFIGLKIHHYLKSAPPVTWNSATFSYLEAFQAGLHNSKDVCDEPYETCNYNLRRIMKFLWMFLKPVDVKTVSGL